MHLTWCGNPARPLRTPCFGASLAEPRPPTISDIVMHFAAYPFSPHYREGGPVRLVITDHVHGGWSAISMYRSTRQGRGPTESVTTLLGRRENSGEFFLWVGF